MTRPRVRAGLNARVWWNCSSCGMGVLGLETSPSSDWNMWVICSGYQVDPDFWEQRSHSHVSLPPVLRSLPVLLPPSTGTKTSREAWHWLCLEGSPKTQVSVLYREFSRSQVLGVRQGKTLKPGCLGREHVKRWLSHVRLGHRRESTAHGPGILGVQLSVAPPLSAFDLSKFVFASLTLKIFIF